MSGSEKTVLVLQGGGALGAYQGGAYEALAAAGTRPTGWRESPSELSTGQSSPAIPQKSASTGCVSSGRWCRAGSSSRRSAPTILRVKFSTKRAPHSLPSTGAPGFFDPRVPPAFFMPSGTLEAIGIYDTGPLKRTLLELVDFDLLNSGASATASVPSMSRPATSSTSTAARRRSIPSTSWRAGALPPGFPPVEIDGRLYWDGGIVSNTPLQYVIDGRRAAPRHGHLPARPVQRQGDRCPRRCLTCPRVRRKSATPAARASTPIISR